MPFRRLRHLSLLLFVAAISVFILVRIPGRPRPLHPSPHFSTKTKSLKAWPFLPERSLLRKHFKPICSAGKVCVGLGSTLFHSWDTWVTYATTWTSSFKKCPVSDCEFVSEPETADAVIFHARDLYNSSLILQHREFHPSQRWIYFSWESPLSMVSMGYNVLQDPPWRYVFNWTATYERTADIQTSYGATERRDSTAAAPPQPITARKHLAFAVLSNCETHVKRLPFLRALQEHMELHIYGRCGQQFPYKDFKAAARDYYFYFAMENSRCKDYITEKFWLNALNVGAVPVAFGPPVRDYVQAAPPGSFVAGEEFASPRLLAQHLKGLAANPERFKAFFAWKRTHRLRKADKAEDFLCKLCAKLHSDQELQSMDLLKEWNTASCNQKPWI